MVMLVLALRLMSRKWSIVPWGKVQVFVKRFWKLIWRGWLARRAFILVKIVSFSIKSSKNIDAPCIRDHDIMQSLCYAIIMSCLAFQERGGYSCCCVWNLPVTTSLGSRSGIFVIKNRSSVKDGDMYLCSDRF